MNRTRRVKRHETTTTSTTTSTSTSTATTTATIGEQTNVLYDNSQDKCVRNFAAAAAAAQLFALATRKCGYQGTVTQNGQLIIEPNVAAANDKKVCESRHYYGFAHLYPQVLDDDVAYAAAGGGRGGGACPVIVVVFVGRDDPMPFVGRHRRPAAQPTAVRRRRSAVARFQGHGHNGRRASRRRVTARRTVARTRKL